MRLIDADALNLSMMLIAPGETKKYCYPCREILKEIDDAPTIEPDTDTISRQAAIEKMQEVDWYHQNKNGEMVHGANSAEDQAWYKAEDVYKVLEELQPSKANITRRKNNK